jgi:hypothetical protein
LRKIKHINLTSSVIAAGLIFIFLIILNHHDVALMMLGFAFLQITMCSASVCLILLRVISLLKNKNAWFYYFSGTMQAGLCITDITLLLLNHSIIKSSLIIFSGLNAVLATIIFYDIYNASYAK